MNSKGLSFFMLIFFTVNLLNSVSSLRLMNPHGVKSAYIAEVHYPKSEMYQACGNSWNFTVNLIVHNVNCSEDASGQTLFFFKFYRNEEIWWDEYNDSAYKVWRCDIGRMQRRSYKVLIPTWMGPKNYDFKVELYWYHDGVSYIQDTTCFTITCVLRLHPQHQFVIGYICIYSFVIIVLSLYLLATGRIKISAKSWKSTLWHFDPFESALSSGVEYDRLCLMRANYSRWLSCQVCAYE